MYICMGRLFLFICCIFFLSCPPTHLSFDGGRDLSLSCFSLSSFLQVLELIMLWPKSICVVCHVLLVRGVWPEASISSLIRHLTTCFHKPGKCLRSQNGSLIMLMITKQGAAYSTSSFLKWLIFGKNYWRDLIAICKPVFEGMNINYSFTKNKFALWIIFVSDLNESLARRHNGTGSPTDDDFQPAKKRFRTPGNQVNYKYKWTMAGFILLEIIPNGFYNLWFL